jgi:hypothetical protein
VLASIPVVFFTAKGIPGEVEERVDTPAGLVAASMRAMGLGEWRTVLGSPSPVSVDVASSPISPDICILACV